MMKKIAIWGVACFALVVILLIIIPLILIPLSFLLNRDVENVNLSGKVYDKISEKPVSGVELVIENWLYDGGDYDSFSKSELYKKKTNANGEFSLDLEKSAWIVIYASKQGYIKDTLNTYASTSIELDIELQKELEHK